MLENIVNGFEEMMNCVLTAMNESLSDPYAGWNEGEELLMLNDVRCGIRCRNAAIFRISVRGSFFANTS